MKNIAKRLNACFMVFIIILSMCGSINKVSAHEFIATINGEELKIDAQDVTYEWRKNIRGKPLKIIGKASKDDFMSIEFISSECETLDMSELEIDVIPHESFIGREKLKEVILPKCLKKIEFCCFSECYNLETVVLPKTLKQIRYDTFLDCPKLRLEIPSNIKVDSDKFHGSPGVTIVEADPDPVCGCWTRMWQWLDDLKEKIL